ncbi:MAG: DNA-processing protein DprA [Alphaproteobacteria bacterium]
MVVKNLSFEEKIKYLRLLRSENVGPKTFMNILTLYSTIDEALKAVPELAALGGKKIKICSKSDAEKEYEDTVKLGGEILAYTEEAYSRLLLEIDNFPPLITILGNKELLSNTDNIAVVGSRNFSANGYNFAKTISRELGEAGFIITSGLARGIDTASHTSALETGTIAVIAGGIDNIYPPENRDLYAQIKEKGLIIAEMPYGTIPKGQNFPRRNRIISGLSLGVIVVEASINSGSLITAKFALEQNREIFAVPGFPLDPRYEGNNKLLREGANLIRNSEDIIEQLKFIRENKVKNFSEKTTNSFHIQNKIFIDENELSKARMDIPKYLSSSPTLIDDLIKHTGFHIQVILTILLELELAGKLERYYGNKVALLY